MRLIRLAKTLLLAGGLLTCGFGSTAWADPKPGIVKDVFGTTADGVRVDRYTLTNANGMTVRLITFGATITELRVPDRDGKLEDVVLGFDRLAQYETQSPYFGCIVGRVAFRISYGKFKLDGKDYRLTLNDGQHHLHGGTKGFDKVVWKARPIKSKRGLAVKLTHHSPDGDQGYPGNLDVAVIYTLTDRNEIVVNYKATTDKPTPVNLTHHSYFNLAGAASGDVLGHVLLIDADRYSVTDELIIATGKMAPVEGTPLDFRKPTAIGARIDKVGGNPSGYDLAYLHNHPGGKLARVATMTEPTSGRVLKVYTNQPAIIFYTGNFLDGTLKGKGGVVYKKHAAFTMETGTLPDSVNQPSFTPTILRPGQTYRHTCIYRFSTK